MFLKLMNMNVSLFLEDYTKILINDIYQIEIDFIESAIQSKRVY